MKFAVSFIIIMLLFCFGICSYAQAQEIGWEEDFKTGVDDWYDIDSDASYNARITTFQKQFAKVKEAGNENWGKAAIVILDLDLDKYSIVKAKIKHVEPGSNFRIGVASLDWSQYYDVIGGDNNTEAGVYKGDIKKKTPWKGNKSFILVIIIGGNNKAIILEGIKITSKD